MNLDEVVAKIETRIKHHNDEVKAHSSRYEHVEAAAHSMIRGELIELRDFFQNKQLTQVIAPEGNTYHVRNTNAN